VYKRQEYAIPDLKLLDIDDALLDQYSGVYGSPTFPLKITVAKSGKTITAQATGQGAFPLEAKGDHQFVFDPAGITMIFDIETNTMTFTQGGGKFELKKE